MFRTPAFRFPDSASFSRRHPACLFILFFFPLVLAAQMEEKPPTVRIAAVSLLDTPPPELFFRDYDEQLKPFIVARGSRSQYNEVPQGKSLQLYRKETNETGQTVAVPSLSLDLDNTERPTLFLLHLDYTGKVRIRGIPADEQAHPSGSISLLNLCGKPIAVMLGQEQIMLAEGENRTVEIPEATTLSFTWAFNREDMKPYHSATLRLRLYQADQRLMIPFAGNVKTMEVGSGRKKKIVFPNAYRLYDTPPVAPES